MSEYEHSTVVEAAPETVFDFVSNAQNSSLLVPAAYQSETRGPSDPTLYDGWLRIHPGEYLMEWGRDGQRSYSGWLQIEEMGDGVAEITMHLSFPSHPDMDTASAEQDLLRAMHAIKEQIERQPLRSETFEL